MKSDLYVTGKPAADRLLRNDGTALLIGMLLDQQVPMEWAFTGPFTISERLGHLEPSRIAAMDIDQFVAMCCEKPAIHRFPASMARRIHELCAMIAADYRDDGANVWRGVADARELFARLRKFPGFGDEKARIFVALLAKRFGVAPEILVTGGAGYIGSHTAHLLAELGRDVVVLDTLERGYRDAVGDLDLVIGDIADDRVVAKTCRKYDVDSVIHFAAYKAVGESVSQPLKYYKNNVSGTIALVETLIANGVNRIVFSSSAAVYGTPDSSPVNEDAPLRPQSPYAQSKADVEHFLRSCDATGLRSVCLRYFNAAGAHDSGDFGDDYPTPDGTCVRDYVHVADLADAHVKALDYLATGGTSLVCNVGTGQGTSVRQLVEVTESVTSRSVPHAIGPRRAGDPASVYADPTLIRA
ncbi:MAG: NAD-dependent epimerase/dehydratase family protein, partial [Actinobacteria bacterium]|nr:NAD-dependent epimerase/dehydratase family protein [Actinomycetota bacterium]